MALNGNFLDRVKQNTGTTGTGTVTLGTAVSPYQTFASAGAVNSTVYWYLIEDGSTAWEIGYGTYSTGGVSLTRTLVQSSTGSLLNLTGSATVSVIAPGRSMTFLGASVKKSADLTAQNYTTGTVLTWNAEDYDVGGWHDTVTNNTRLTVPAGYNINYVKLGAHISVASDTPDSWHSIDVYKNNSLLRRLFVGSEGGAAVWCAQGETDPISVTAGDYFEVYYQTEADTSTDITAATTRFYIYAVG